MQVLLLNASEEVLGTIDWQKAMLLWLGNKVVRPSGHDDFYNIRTPRMIYRLPTVLILTKYVRIPYKHAAVTKSNILVRDNFECQYCGKRLTHQTGTIDHIVPVSRGGAHRWDNVVVSCKKCNNKKDNKTPKEARMALETDLYTLSGEEAMIKTIKFHPSWSRWFYYARA